MKTQMKQTDQFLFNQHCDLHYFFMNPDSNLVLDRNLNPDIVLERDLDPPESLIGIEILSYNLYNQCFDPIYFLYKTGSDVRWHPDPADSLKKGLYSPNPSKFVAYQWCD